MTQALRAVISWIRLPAHDFPWTSSCWALALALSTSCTPAQEDVACTKVVSATTLVLYNHTSADSIIGEPSDAISGYERSGPWSNDGPYLPKFFDAHIATHEGYDSLRVDLNGFDEDQTHELLTRPLAVVRQSLAGPSRFWVKDIPFASFFNDYPLVTQLNFHFTVYRDGTACRFVKTFSLGEREGYLPEE